MCIDITVETLPFVDQIMSKISKGTLRIMDSHVVFYWRVWGVINKMWGTYHPPNRI
jgi:hypothetical protein